MKREKKHKSSLWARVAATVVLVMSLLLPSSADVIHTIELKSLEEVFNFSAGTVRKKDGKLYVTPNAGYLKGNVKMYKVDNDIIVSENVGEMGVVINNEQVSYYDCNGDWDYAEVIFRHSASNVNVTFDMNGHGGTAPNAQNLLEFSTDNVLQPDTPTEEGFVFGGWFMDANVTVPFDFNTKLNTIEYSSYTSSSPKHYNLTLYAKWLEIVNDENCGTDVTWSGYRNVKNNSIEGEITISGTGEIAQDAFRGNVNLRSVVINDGVTSIGEAAFRNTGLTSVTIPNSVTSIGEGAFSWCDGLTSVTIPNSVTSIGKDVFWNCPGLTSVTIPASVTSIGEGAFTNCIGLTSVTIPNSVTSIGNFAFADCIGLTSVTIPNSVTSIGKAAFSGCTGLTSVTIPNSVTSIGEDAFCDCSGLTSVTIYAPSLGENGYGATAFVGNADDRKIYVFENCVDTYKAGWSGTDFVDDIVGIPEGNLSVNTTVNANPQAAGEYWSTYYHPAANVKINTSDVEIYKATLNEQKTSVALTKIGDSPMVIKAGQAVMLKAATAGDLSMTLTPEAPTGDYSDNDLKGGSTVPTGYNAYTLAAENSTFGFYKFTGTLNGSKAHLEIPQGSTTSRSFIGFDASDATRLVNNEQRIVNNEWFTLDGCRIANGQKPTARGLYIHNGRKEVVK